VKGSHGLVRQLLEEENGSIDVEVDDAELLLLR
jgi:hypothetical protein